MKTYHDLAAPSETSLARSSALCAVIREKIQQHNGNITFADFMELALYHPLHGYYQRRDFALGKLGDFTTAPEISPLFAQCFARQCQQIFTMQTPATILELGAGTGRFALDLMSALETLKALPQHYFIYEVSTSLRQQQQALLQTERPDLLTKVEWLTELPQQFAGVVIANEVLDAIPFHCFEISGQHIMERMVATNQNEFIWQTDLPSSPLLHDEIKKLSEEYSLADGYQSEIHLPAMTLVRQLCEALTSGVILLADYGYGQREYYHPQRSQGSLACFYQHHLLANPFIYPGLMDITAHVDFTRVIETAAATGAQLAGFTTQSAFLLANGLLDIAAEQETQLTETAAFRMHQQIKVLTMPMEMGERVKMMALSKNFNSTLTGFTTLDRRRDL
jgi:SAM-dependent MidA family methyltransferase